MNKYLSPKNYLNFILKNILNFCAPFIKIWEKKYFKKYASQSLKHQPVFIIGAPRTGSTILHQTITNQLDVLYIDNLVCWFNKNFFFGFWLSNKLFKQKAHNCFKSIYGNTSKFGLHAPSECGAFWYKWLPTDIHFIDYNNITDEMVREIREEITTVINFFDKPLIFNNNNIGLRIRLIKQAFPDAKYIIADREPFFVSQSLLVARDFFFGNYNTWWSMMPRNFKEIKKLNFVKQVVQQHYFINKQMYADLKSLVENDNYQTVQYSNFVKDKNIILNKIMSLINYTQKRNKIVNNDIYESKKIKLKKKIVMSLKKEIEIMDWND